VGRVTYPTLRCGGDLRLESVGADRVAVTEQITWGRSRCVEIVPLDLVRTGPDTVRYTFYENDLPSGKVNGEATLRRTGAVTNDVPEIFRGSWHGQMTQPNSSPSRYSMAVGIDGGPLNAKVGTVEYADLSCGGDWILRQAQPQRLVVEEDITYGRCLHGYLEVTPTADGMSVTFSTREDLRAPIAWATLSSG
jgi:hypothetical protein